MELKTEHQIKKFIGIKLKKDSALNILEINQRVFSSHRTSNDNVDRRSAFSLWGNLMYSLEPKLRSFLLSLSYTLDFYNQDFNFEYLRKDTSKIEDYTRFNNQIMFYLKKIVITIYMLEKNIFIEDVHLCEEGERVFKEIRARLPEIKAKAIEMIELNYDQITRLMQEDKMKLKTRISNMTPSSSQQIKFPNIEKLKVRDKAKAAEG